MANQRAKDKRNVTVTMEDELREAVEAYAKIHGLDRTAAVKELLKQSLAAPKSPRKK
jgi:hypothetical protein